MSDYRTNQSLEQIANCLSVLATKLSSPPVVRIGGSISWWWGGALFTLGFLPAHLTFWRCVFTIVAWPFVLGQQVATFVAK